MSETEKKSSDKTTVVFWVVVVCLAVWAAALTIPNFVRARVPRQGNYCINSLRQIDAAAQEFALECSKTNGDIIHYPNDLTPYIKLNRDGKIPPCPQGGTYSIKRVGDVPTCSLGTTVTPAHVLP